MKLKTGIILSIFLIAFSCDKNEEVQVGEITEISQEEIENRIDMAPGFAFNSVNGSQVSLEDLKGKFVYIDIWATWCRPCIMQIPTMKEVEQIYKDKDIEFVSISIDSERDKPKWKKMIGEKQMGGIQLFAGRDQAFTTNYKVSTIPRFVLIGKQGELLDANAPRPLNHATNGVNQELLSLFDRLLEE